MQIDVLNWWDVTRPYVRRDLFVYETWLTFMECTLTQPRMLTRCEMMCWIDGTWLVHVWDVAHLYLWHDSLMVCISWQSRLLTRCGMLCLMYMWDVTHFVYAWHDSFMVCMREQSRLPNAWDVIHSYGVATLSRLLKITGLFCKRGL